MRPSRKYIIGQEFAIVKSKLKIIFCNHFWKSEGYGWKCEKCGYYTGMNKKLNEMIDDQ